MLVLLFGVCVLECVMCCVCLIVCWMRVFVRCVCISCNCLYLCVCCVFRVDEWLDVCALFLVRLLFVLSVFAV